MKSSKQPPSFAALIKERQRQLWTLHPNDPHSPVECEAELRTRHDPIERWKCCDHWHRKLSQKLNAKEFCLKCGVRAPELYWYGHDIEKIPSLSLPEQYVVKLSNGSGGKQVIPVVGGVDLFHQRNATPQYICSTLKMMIAKTNDPMIGIIIEELICGRPQLPPDDFKFYCFHGRAELLYLVRWEWADPPETGKVVKTVTWYDRMWKKIDDPMYVGLRPGTPIAAPQFLPELIEVAEEMAAHYDFPFVRIDLYRDAKSVVFGEFTHTPLGNKTWEYTDYANRLMGELWSGI
jgi:TupA-like ATPgrasp